MRTDESAGPKMKHKLRLGRAVRLVWQSAPGWTIASSAFVVLQGILPLLSLYLVKLVVDSVTAGIAAPDKGVAFFRVAIYIGLTGVVTLVGALSGSIAGLIRNQQTYLVTDHMYDILHAKSIEVDLEYYESPQYYDTLHRAQQEGPSRPTSIVNDLVQLGQSGISLVAVAGLLLSFHWSVAVILFVATIPGVLVQLKYAGKMYRWQRKRTPTERLTSYFNWILTGSTYAKEVRLFDFGSLFMERFRNLRRQLRHERRELAIRRSLAGLAAQADGALAAFALYAFIAYRTVQGIITMGDLIMYRQAFQRVQGYLRGILMGLAGLYEHNLFLSNLYEFLDLERKVVEPSHPVPVPQPMRTGIVFEHVGFQYPTGTRKVLEDVSMTIQPGEVVALVGENGSGKTTLIKLLSRLYDPTGGTITIDGVDLRQFKTTALRREIGVIFQDYAQYYLTARENIWLGNLDLPPDHERIEAAARHSGADDVITGLPQGYETILGKWFEDGEELSVGEWQKVALARAFLRDTQIIVLDEPTSSMDAKAEYEVFKEFRKLAEGRTAVIISHRFSTVRMADRIYVLEDGRITEGGSHDELVRLGGTYARLFETQAQYYR